MYDVKNKSRKHLFFICLGVVVFVSLVYIYYGLRSGDFNGGADTIRNQLGNAQKTQQSITDGVTNAEKRIEGSEQRLDSSLVRFEDGQRRVASGAARAETIEDCLSQSARIIEDCEQIIRGIRERTKENPAEAKGSKNSGI